jgi:WD40 repeat protein
VGSPDVSGEWIVRPSSGASTHVSIGGIPAWSPDSTRLAAVRSSTLRVIATTGGRPRALAHGANPPVLWLGSGRIAYVTQARVRSVIETAPDGGFGRVLLHGPTRFDAQPRVDFAGLAWAPEGSALAYLYGSELHVAKADGSRSRLLARGVTDAPAWSPDGRLIAIAANGLRLVPAVGGPARLLTRAGDTAPAWSPDGRRIAFLAGDYLYSLYVVDRDGSHLRQLADGVSSAPSWSPDGKRIAFSTGEDYGPTAIETVRYDGTGLTTLASATAEDT